MIAPPKRSFRDDGDQTCYWKRTSIAYDHTTTRTIRNTALPGKAARAQDVSSPYGALNESELVVVDGGGLNCWETGCVVAVPSRPRAEKATSFVLRLLSGRSAWQGRIGDQQHSR